MCVLGDSSVTPIYLDFTSTTMICTETIVKIQYIKTLIRFEYCTDTRFETLYISRCNHNYSEELPFESLQGKNRSGT